MNSWDEDFLALCEFWANRRSKDPSTKVGSVIVRPDKSIVSLAFNGFPMGVGDDEHRYENRLVKYPMVCHAERNAIDFSNTNLKGCTLYTNMKFICEECAKSIIQNKITRVVMREGEIPERWRQSWCWAALMFREAGIEYQHIKGV